jgi:hypothetical protein
MSHHFSCNKQEHAAYDIHYSTRMLIQCSVCVCARAGTVSETVYDCVCVYMCSVSVCVLQYTHRHTYTISPLRQLHTHTHQHAHKHTHKHNIRNCAHMGGKNGVCVAMGWKARLLTFVGGTSGSVHKEHIEKNLEELQVLMSK